MNAQSQGTYIFENNTSGDLFLPRPTQSGRKYVRKGEQFIGDNYYFEMVRTHELKLMKTLDDGNKLMTEQPPTVTTQGKVEFVQKHNNHYNEEAVSTQDVLLTESPVDGIKVIR